MSKAPVSSPETVCGPFEASTNWTPPTYAYGAEGPLSDFGGLDPLHQAACGLEFEAGPVAGGNPPLYLRFGMTDTANTMVSAVGMLAALYHQRRTGEGQDLWTSLLNGAAVFSSDVFLVEGEPGPVRPGLDSNQMGVSPCCRLYETREGWAQVAAFASGQWALLCRLVGRPDLARYETIEARVAARVEIESALEPIFLTRTAVSWFHNLGEAGVDAEVSVDTDDGEASAPRRRQRASRPGGGVSPSDPRTAAPVRHVD